jgi:hypothetical protein
VLIYFSKQDNEKIFSNLVDICGKLTGILYLASCSAFSKTCDRNKAMIELINIQDCMVTKDARVIWDKNHPKVESNKLFFKVPISFSGLLTRIEQFFVLDSFRYPHSTNIK